MDTPLNAPMNGPKPRKGWKGSLDRLAGPGATAVELWVQMVPAFVALVVAPVYAMTLPIEWSPWQLGLIGLFGLDLVGGVLTNATSSAKRWFHRPGQGWRQHLSFVAIHSIHLGIVAFLFRGGDWGYWLGVMSYLLGASMVILKVPLYLQRPVAMGLYGLALLGDRYLFSPTLGLEWFLPLFFLKLLVSHLLYETPYRPDDERGSFAL